MKTLPRLTKCALFVVVAFCASAYQCDRKHNVVLLPNAQDTDQIVLPGTEISEADASVLMRILNSDRNKRFYTIKHFEPNMVPTVAGTLPFPKCLEAHGFDPGQIDDGNKTGISRREFSRVSRVVGMGCVSRCSNQLALSWLPRYSKKSKEESKELVDKVKPILEKYQAER
jgi:hypothetical protein